MPDGRCLKCGKDVHVQELHRYHSPVIHSGCGGDVVVPNDVKERIRKVLFSRKPFPPPELGSNIEELLKPEQCQTERFIRWLYGIDVRFHDMVGGANKVVPLDGVLSLLDAFKRVEEKYKGK